MKAEAANNSLTTLDQKRDAYGFSVRPQHLQRYREYANIYKEEEEERSERWKDFLERQAESTQLSGNRILTGERIRAQNIEGQAESTQLSGNRILTGERIRAQNIEGEADTSLLWGDDGNNLSRNKSGRDLLRKNVMERVVPVADGLSSYKVEIWTPIRPSLHVIEHMMNNDAKRKNDMSNNESESGPKKPVDEAKSPNGAPEEDSDEEFYDLDRSDVVPETPSCDDLSAFATSEPGDIVTPESLRYWKEELECLVRGGVPMALRGELWQVFVGARARHLKNYYQDLLSAESKSSNSTDQHSLQPDDSSKKLYSDSTCIPDKWKGQIEKDLPRTFPGHPALDEGGRNALRRLLTAYARHNPSVGYCQAMNFFAGLLLLLMPEENAFWTLMAILDDYFDGYYSEEMIESQVDQLVFDELMRERFPKLVNHLDFLGVQVAWVTGPWFLSIFMNMLPWESVLRVWDVLLFEGNRIMLFKTALALMELYGPALVTAKDAGDAITLLQSLAGSTFDSSQLVLTACMGYQNVNEDRLQQLRLKHRPAVVAAIEERWKGLQALKDSQPLPSKLFGFKHDPGSLMVPTSKRDSLVGKVNGDVSDMEAESANCQILISLSDDSGIDSVPDLQEQVKWLKVELCKLLEENRSSNLRAEELETALMEMVEQDNRRQLSAKVEQLEHEVAKLQLALAAKQEQERAMLQVLMRVEQEQKVTEDARRFAEQHATAQRHASQVLQEKYEEAIGSLAQMEKRAVMVESMLEATLQYQSGQVKAQPSPRSVNPDSSGGQNYQEQPSRKMSLLGRPFGLGWSDKNKAEPSKAAPNDVPESERRP